MYQYFLQKEKEWESIAKKYNIDSETLHQIINEYGFQDSIEEQYLNGLKNKITRPKV